MNSEQASLPPPLHLGQSAETSHPQEHQWPIGSKVRKYFSGYGVFMGKVTAYDDGLYHIVYSDGDEEDFDEQDMQQHLFLYNNPCLPMVPAVTPPPPVLLDVSKRPSDSASEPIHSAPKRLKLDKAGEQESSSTPLVTLPSLSTSCALLMPPEKESSLVSFDALYDKKTPIHTLILGTFPAEGSLLQARYFSNARNAFWWIAGDCLGFRRDKGELQGGSGRLALCQDLDYDESYCIPYEEQVERLCSKGFALWDVLASCKREGSRDGDIKRGSARPNDIRGFVKQHPTIRRIVFASGKSTARHFNEHFKQWWQTGELVYYGDDQYSVEAFRHMLKDDIADPPNSDAIVCICAKSVSPSDASTPYKEKKEFWRDHVYNPGLELHNSLRQLEGSHKEEEISTTNMVEI